MHGRQTVVLLRAAAAAFLAAFLMGFGGRTAAEPAGIGSDRPAQAASCFSSAEYYPLAVGDWWRYAEREWSSDDGSHESEYTNRITGTERIDGVDAAKMEDDDGDYDLFSSTAGDGVWMYGSVEVEAPDYREECTYGPPIHYAPAVICVGDEQSFSTDVTCEEYEGGRHVGSSSAHVAGTGVLEAVEDVTVPAGRFESCLRLMIRRRVSVSGHEVEYSELTLWLARGVGHIKQSEEGFAPGGEGGTPIETSDDELLSARVGGVDYPRAAPTATLRPTRTPTRGPTPTLGPCVGDCDHDGEVAVNELVRGVSIALGKQSLEACPGFDVSRDGKVAINELVRAVNSALNGCIAAVF